MTVRCKFLIDWVCIADWNATLPTLEDCKFCKEARLMYVSQYKPLVEDYWKNIEELNRLRLEKARQEELPK